MQNRFIGACVGFLILSNLGYAQTGLDGKWSSNATEMNNALNAARAALPSQNAGVTIRSTENSSMTTLGVVQMNLSLDGNKVNGSIVQGVTATMVTQGTFDGRIGTLKTQRQTENGLLYQTWTIELKDSDTFLLTVDAYVAGPNPNPNGSFIIPVTMHRVK